MATNMKTLNGYGFDASALGGHDPSYYATSEDIQQVRNEIPDKLPSPNALTINGQRYDGSAAVEINVSSDGSASIDDETPSETTTYSSSKIESELTSIKDEMKTTTYEVNQTDGCLYMHTVN